MSRAAAFAVALLLAGCPKEEPPPPEDRALGLLRQEVDREAAGAPMARSPLQDSDPNARLAGLAAGAETERGPEGPLKLPSDGTSTKAGDTELSVLAADTAHQLPGGKISLTTDELFLKVQLKVKNAGKRTVRVGLPEAKAVGPAGEWPIARDGQALAGTRSLPVELAAGASHDVILIFEIPPAAMKGEAELALAVPSEGGELRALLR